MALFTFATILAFAALAGRSDTIPADPCASHKLGAARGIEAFVVTAPARLEARDTIVRATVCVVPVRPQVPRIASYHGELLFDSTAARVLSVVKPADGMRVENTTGAGRVRFAGAAPSGFSESTLLTVVLRVRTPAVVPKIRLHMRELNGTDGADLMKQLVTSSVPRP